MPASDIDWDEIDRQGRAQQQADRDQRDADRREQQRRNIPTRFRNATVDHPQVRGWVDERDPAKPALFLTGPTGTGKTHIAWAIIGQLVDRSWAFWRSTALLDELRPDTGEDHRKALLRHAQTVDLLVIDDLGAEKPSQWTQERFYELIDERYVWQRHLVITSNKPPSALGSSVGDRVAGRIAEMSVVVPLLGADRRRAKTTEGTR